LTIIFEQRLTTFLNQGRGTMTSGTFSLSSTKQLEFIDITSSIAGEIRKSGIPEGICCLYNPHTTAGLTINEGADPAVRRDIIDALRKIVPLDHPYQHQEGNSPAHIMAAMTGTSATVFIEEGSLKLGTWQKIFFCEFDGPRTRKVHWRIIRG
jgi:secondary thiamine-phosphate synthase enzyme